MSAYRWRQVASSPPLLCPNFGLRYLKASMGAGNKVRQARHALEATYTDISGMDIDPTTPMESEVDRYDMG